MSSARIAFDIIGDIHGELPALRALGSELGYDVDRDEWPHPEGRRLIFLGDLVDRGGHSLEVAQIVHRLCRLGRAACVMGNHEYNLVAHDLKVPGYEDAKHSNRATIADIKARPSEWRPVLEFFRELPLALEMPDLRIIHACWHLPSFAQVREHLAPEGARATDHWASKYVALRSPFEATGLNPRLPKAEGRDDDAPHEILIKGYEEATAKLFHDADGKKRTRVRATWWSPRSASVLLDRPMVVGHYWNLPPVGGEFCPPEPSGHPRLKAWQKENSVRVSDHGTRACDADIICVDYNGLTAASERACVGALRWPERQVVWATSLKTRGLGSTPNAASAPSSEATG
jgi:hypothetical protein